MFAVIYKFQVKEGAEKAFIEAWEQLTHLIRDTEKSGGSRLHKLKGLDYIAYAKWDARSHWENAGSSLPSEADKWRKQMRESCEDISTEMELDIVSDLLV